MIYCNDLGGVEENFEFTLEPETSAYKSCSAMLNGELFVFGGSYITKFNKQVISMIRRKIKSNNENQVSKIMDCELKRIGDLPYAFEMGACGTFLFEDRVFTEERVIPKPRIFVSGNIQTV